MRRRNGLDFDGVAAAGQYRWIEHGRQFLPVESLEKRSSPWLCNSISHRIISFGVESAYIDGVSVCGMFNHVIAGELFFFADYR